MAALAGAPRPAVDLGAGPGLIGMASAIVAPASWTACDPAALPPGAPRFDAPPRAAFTRGARLLRLDFARGALVAKRMADPAGAERLLALLQPLAHACEHVPAPSLARGEDGRTWWLCAPFLEGAPWIESRGSHAVVGTALASLHAAMRLLPRDGIVAAAAARHARVHAWIDENAEAPEVRTLAGCAGMDVGALRGVLGEYLAAPAQPVHHDLHPSNVWWSGEQLFFLDYDELPSAHLPVAADLARYIERHLVAPGEEASSALGDFWLAYAARSGAGMPGSRTLFAALAWNWLDSWSTLQGFAPRPMDYDVERAKFLELLQLHRRQWKHVAARVEALAA